MAHLFSEAKVFQKKGSLVKFDLFQQAAGVVLFLGICMQPGKVFAIQASDFRNEIVNPVDLEESLIGGGLISEKGIRIAAENGVRTLIDIRSPIEGTAQMRAKVEARGLRYVNIPFTWGLLGKKQAEALRNVLSDKTAKPAILFCRSGNRVRMLWALYQKK